MPDNTGIYESVTQPVGSEAAKSMVEGISDEILLFPRYADPYPVYIHMPVWRQLWQYACDNKDREIGGVLLGSVLQDESGEGINIQAYLPGRYMEETLANLTFTHKTWTDINQRHMREHNDKRIIGWFHTHPGHGIFMSRYDLYIHQNYFAGDGQIAAVFDPVHNSAGFFQRREDRMLQQRRIHIYTMPGYAFDQNTRDFIAEVGEHSLPQCQPTLGLPSFRMDIQNGPIRETRHQGLAFLVRLMDIRKQDKTQTATEETKNVSKEDLKSNEAVSLVNHNLAAPGGNNELSTASTQSIGTEPLELEPSSGWVAASISTKTDVMGQLGENLDLYSADLRAVSVGPYQVRDEVPTHETAAFLYTPLPNDGADGRIGMDTSPLSLPPEAVSPRGITPEVDEERLDVVKKKLTPIKDQAIRDLRQAEREILSPSGYLREGYKAKTPYNGDMGSDTLNLMS